MSYFDKHSRVNKFEKRRKNTKSISLLIIVSIILIIILLGMWIFGGGEDDQEDGEQETTNGQNEDGQADNGSEKHEFEIDEDKTDNNEENSNDDTDDNDNESDDNDSDDVSIPSDDIDTEEIDDPEDNNVKKAYTGNWQAIGTTQSEPHETQFDQKSQDWKEMEEAIKYATGLNEMTTHWIGNAGDQKVTGTVTDANNSTIYRVYLSWETDEGWRPTRVELLNELDKD